MAELYPAPLVLDDISKGLGSEHPDLKVELPSRSVRYEVALRAAAQSVADLDDCLLLPTTNPRIREALRQMALEQLAWQEARPSPLPVRPSGGLRLAECPEPLTGSRRQILKKNFLPPSDATPKDPYRLTLHATRSEMMLPSIIAHATITAIDWEMGLPVAKLKDAEMLWDTGAYGCIITPDILDPTFQDHLKDEIHTPYLDSDGTRVQLSLAVDFSNTTVQIGTIATVADRQSLPNVRSGTILGQNGCIDRVLYQSIPRSIVLAEGGKIEEKFWGDFLLQKYVALEGELKDLD